MLKIPLKAFLFIIIAAAVPTTAQTARPKPTSFRDTLDGASSAAPLTLDDIVRRNTEARGGIEKIKAIRNIVFRGPPRPDGRPGRFLAKARPFYYLVGEPTPTRSFAEGFDGSAWEFYGDVGLVIRTTNAPAAAARHTAYIDDPLIGSLDGLWKLELKGSERIGDRDAYSIIATGTDGFQRNIFVDKQTWLTIAERHVAPIHAFGESVKTETRIGEYRMAGGVLFPTRGDEYEIATGRRFEDLSGGWATVDVNVDLPTDYFSPPPEPKTKLARMLNAIYDERFSPVDALAWYKDFRIDPSTSTLNTEAGIEAVGYQCLKNGAVGTGVSLLEANLSEYPRSAAAHFGLGRGYRAAGREKEAVAEFQKALAIDPSYKRASAALTAGSHPDLH